MEEAVTPIHPSTVILSVQFNDITPIEQAPVIKKIKTMNDDAAPTSLSTCSRIRLLLGGRQNEKEKVSSHIGTASRHGVGIHEQSIRAAAPIIPVNPVVSRGINGKRRAIREKNAGATMKAAAFRPNK